MVLSTYMQAIVDEAVCTESVGRHLVILECNATSTMWRIRVFQDKGTKEEDADITVLIFKRAETFESLADAEAAFSGYVTELHAERAMEALGAAMGV